MLYANVMLMYLTVITHCEVDSLPGYLQVHYSKKLDISTVQSFKSSPLQQAFSIEVHMLCMY